MFLGVETVKQVCLTIAVSLAASVCWAADFDLRIVRGSVQLGGSFVTTVESDKALPEGSTCILKVPEPFAAHVQQVSTDCAALEIAQKHTPILDADGYATASMIVQ